MGAAVRVRIMSYYVALFGILYVIIGLVVYFYFTERLRADGDVLLESRAEGILESLETYLALERSPAQTPLTGRGSGQSAADPITQSWLNDQLQDLRQLNTIVVILSADMRRFVSTGRIPAPLPISAMGREKLLAGRELFENQALSLPDGKPLHLRVYSVPLTRKNRVDYIVQVAGPLDSLLAASRTLGLILLLLAPPTVLITGLGGYFSSAAALRPLHRITETMCQISSENIATRIRCPQTRDEIQALAETFNGLLDRIDASLIQQKRLIEDVSHQIKTPLAIIKGEIETTLARARTRAEYERTLQSNLEEVDKLSCLLERLLLLARLDSMRQAPSQESMDLAGVLAATVEDFGILAAARRIEIRTLELPPSPFRGNEQQIRQVFANLLDNALKFSPDGARVSVALSRSADGYEISFQDQGPGILESDLPHIFERFYRGRQGVARDGFGLGLNIARSITELHGGALHVASSPREGSRFTVLLPGFPRGTGPS